MQIHRAIVLAAGMTFLSTGMVLGQGVSGGGRSGVEAPASPTGSDLRSPGVGGLPGTINSDLGGTKPSPPVSGQGPSPLAPPDVRGVAEQAPSATTGMSRVADDGISTKNVPARPCSKAARGTDGTTTCIGIPVRR